MKSAVMIAYWFPPEGNAAVYRPLRFVRNLPAFGWTARVVTGGTQFERLDLELLRQVPEGTEVIRVPHGDLWQVIQARRGERLRGAGGGAPSQVASGLASSDGATVRSRVRGWVRKAESWWYHPDMQRSWIRPAVKATLDACARARPDVLWATGPPWSAFVVARGVAKRTGLPYVLDFRTSWTIVPSSFEADRPGWAQNRDRRTLRTLFQDAAAVTFFYEAEAECFWRLYKGSLDPSRIHVIPNGFDGEVEEAPLPESDVFRVLYTGTLSDYRYETFLEALGTMKRRDPGLVGRMAVHFVGEGSDEVARAAALHDVAGMVTTSAPVAHSEANRLQRESHALLMFERRPTLKGYQLLAGAKLFGYLKAGRPILGVVPEGEAAKVLRDVGVTTIADPERPDAVCAVLETMLGAWAAGRLSSLVPDRSACERYSGRAQTAVLSRALAGLPALKPFVPGAVDVVPSLRAEFAASGWA